MKQISPPSGAPEGTEWFGGPVDRFRITLRILGEELDPVWISTLLGCLATTAERKGVPIIFEEGTRIPKRGRWSLTIDSRDCGEHADLEDGVKLLLEQLPSKLELWASLTNEYAVDVFCGVFLSSRSGGFAISAEVGKMLSDRRLQIGFDIYCDSRRTG